jgi:BirA family biotin operon repressor/biotin-[acetyl-CoA-carboxylase] ligase
MSQPEVRDKLSAERLRATLGQTYIGNQVVVVEETRSTNDLVWQMAGEGMSDGLVVFAERQSAGRGQRGNQWESAPSQGLWFSTLLRPGIEPANSARLTRWAADAIATTIQEQLQITPAIKLPNDIYIDGKKIAGVLVEMRVEKNGGYAAIAGIGVNVNQAQADFSPGLQLTARSLAMAIGKTIDRQRFAVALLHTLDRTYRALFAL